MTPAHLIKYFGDDKRAASALGKSVPCIRMWVATNSIPLWSQYAIQTITKDCLVANKSHVKRSNKW